VKTRSPSRPRRNDGGSLVVTLVITLLLGLMLASYLMLVQSQHVSTARSQAWHAAIILAEAGVEEALAQLNTGVTNGAPAVAGGNGWSLSDGFYRPDPSERTLLNGRYAVAYSANVPPLIQSTGYTAISGSGTLLARVVEVTTTNAPLFTSGLGAERFSRSGGATYSRDRYNSQDAARSTGGDYDPKKATPDNNSSILNRNEFPDVLPPFPPQIGLPVKFGNTYTLSGNHYVDGNLSLHGTDRLCVGPNQKATLYITGSFSMGSNTKIEIATTGELRLFVAGNTTRLGELDSRGPPRNFQYFGLPGNHNVYLTDPTANFIGVIYAPDATFTCANPCGTRDFIGALYVGNLVLNRSLKFHFDESLAQTGPSRGFVPLTWRELPH
jgi:Tfp pilus assembly protein PilX